MKRSFFISLFLTGCMVGPTYRPPRPCLPMSFVERGDTVFVEDDFFFEWWKQFGDEGLNEILACAATANFDLRIAIEKICQARANFYVRLSSLFPEIDFDAVATRTKNSRNAATFGSIPLPLAASAPKIQNFFLVGFDAVWELDFFGGLEHAKRAAFYQWQSTSENAAAVQITVLSETAANYIQIRALQNKLALAWELVQKDREAIALVKDRFLSGIDNESQLLAAQDLLYTDEANLFNLEIALKQSVYNLAFLVGVSPDCILEKFQTVEAIPRLCGPIPSSLPSDLLRRRPDIRSAERQIAAANEEVGVAIADLFPKFSLTSSNLFGARDMSSNIGYASNTLDTLFKKSSLTWSIGVTAFLPIVDFGKRLSQVDYQNSVQRESYLNYGKIVIEAIVEVEKALVAYFDEEKRLYYLQNLVDANLRAFQLAHDLFNAGLNDYEKVIQAQKTYLASENNYIDSRQALAINLVRLYKALGGSWECYDSL